MRVLIIGSGGREHAMAWQCAQSGARVWVAPGNAGTHLELNVCNVDIAASDYDALIEFAQNNDIDLTLIGPEQPLVDGIVDRFQAQGLACFGPNAAAAQLEGSKAFSKSFLQRHKIPTASHQTFSDIAAATAHIRQRGAPCVIKADGLAAGKGVVVAQSVDEALQAAQAMLVDARFGDASRQIVVEDFLPGEEASFIAITDGQHILPLATSQDHKARDDGDLGPNTGGMGAYSPAPVMSDAVTQHVMRDVIQPTLAGLAADGINYCGFLYAGLMIDAEGKARVLEFNCRLGDPETQPIMRRLITPLQTLCTAALDGTLAQLEVEWTHQAALGVVLASEGYPITARNGDVISGIAAAERLSGVKVFHAGTRGTDGEIVTAGGRVLCVSALGDTITDAKVNAYEAAAAIHFDGMFCRTDIGYRAIDRERG
ncbi:MAG: phosphoribosylamine--glycine ligase [Pseudomonadota bacterium]